MVVVAAHPPLAFTDTDPGYVPPTARSGAQGYIRTRESLLHVPGLFRYSQPGQLFDPEGSVVMSFVPVIGHSIVILILNQHIYSRIALALTKWENHKHESEFENALILKR